MDDSNLLKQFTAEAADLVESLQEDLDRLAEQHTTGRVNPDLLNRIFRAAHSIKGMAGMAGLEEIRGVAHRFEDLLDDVRMGRFRPSAKAVAVFASVAEGLGRLVAEAGRESSAEAERLVALIDSLRTEPPPPEEEDLGSSVAIDDAVRRTLTEYEEHRLLENVRDRRPLYQINVAFDLMSFDTGFRALNDALTSTGEVISTLPGVGANDPTQIAFRILYASDDPLGTVRARVAAHDAEVAEISHYPAEPVAAAEEPVAEAAPETAAPSVRVEMRDLDTMAVLVQRLALKTAELTSSYAPYLDTTRMTAGEAFDLKQQARVIERGFLELEERLVDLRLVPLGSTFARARRLIRKVAAEVERDIDFTAEGEEVRLDKTIADHIAEPLAHLLTNAVDHGIETPEQRRAAGKPEAGQVALRAQSSGSRVVITVSDDGQGLDIAAIRRAAEERGLGALAEANPFDVIFEPGFSTSKTVSALSGRGVGLDAVAASVRAFGGEISVVSEPGKGSTFALTLPTTLVMISAFFVETAGIPYAIDVNYLTELGLIEPAEIRRENGRPTVLWRGEQIPFVSLSEVLHLPSEPPQAPKRRPCLIARAGDRLTAVAVDRFVEERESIVKTLGRFGPKLKGVTGAIDLEGGRVALLLDVPALLGQEVVA